MNEAPHIISAAHRLLNESKLRNTPVRRGVLGMLLASREAYTSSSLEAALQADRITVFRTLRTLEEAGLLHRIKDTTGVDKYAICDSSCTKECHHDEHAHFHCTSCLQTSCLQDVKVSPQIVPQGFQIQQSHLTYTGICSTCS